MKPFNGKCPECGGEVELVGAEDQGDFVVVTYDCVDCKDRFTVIFSNGIVTE
ncbi:hypothetical protein SPSIL_014980 [Sporomusa silvacetica DSM 10669]|uniref:Uncharacterized protein n=1 Tax=Sporomusa silvacetica DSM 10669 TaxID=1123289 RepID=A0ABZ3IJ31_9FIRM|nr:hypothetical protein [Sporomusa silvacetica]OZC21560.1 hypothetical protein SPSIL_09710 [Sporomusa silvacetica DSM 10669]